MRSQSKKEIYGGNKEGINTQSSSMIESLRSQISKVSSLNRFCFNNNSKKPIEFESEFQMSEIADKIRNKITINRSSKNQGIDHTDRSCSEKIGDVNSPFKKKNKNSENSLLQDKVSKFAQSRSELENLLLININKLRHGRIKLNKDNCHEKNNILFPNIYIPLSFMKFLNIQELYLFLSLFYHNNQGEQIISFLPNLKNLQIIFFATENISVSHSSTIISGRHTQILDDEYLFSNNAPTSKLILNAAK